MYEPVLSHACELASQFLASIEDRHVGPCPTPEELIATLGGPLPVSGTEPMQVITDLARDADPGLVASAGGRFFGFVVGGSHPAALAADWLVSTWDQNGGFYVLSPTLAVIEKITANWLLELFDLPRDATVGFVTGCQMASFMGLATARQSMLARVGWDAARDGLFNAPGIRVIVSEESHGTIDRAVAMLGLGSRRITRVACDEQGRMVPEALAKVLEASDLPTIVCAQAGNVNTGGFDPLREISSVCRQHQAWLHVDGAFGLWVRASETHRHLADGIELADSWATDAHKWLNVPYDSGMVIVRDRASLVHATDYPGEYLVRSEGREDRCGYTPESSRRARAVPVYAALRELGSQGVEALIDRCCELTRHAAQRLCAGGAEILNEVVLNQAMVVFAAPPGVDQTGQMDDLIQRIQLDGTCWLGGTTWHGRRAIRLSVSNWRTTQQDIDRSVDAILCCASLRRDSR